ncbi:hypothetical protein HID58_002168 [Brassica napus]|uniref:Uncharacterized protein n=1 Tax=Brassica napus TaxID=3708 RepID=A0ABQ8EPF9_BRANA|nr:hypothetical protein HID58_002168 [Brassica napus]
MPLSRQIWVSLAKPSATILPKASPRSIYHQTEAKKMGISQLYISDFEIGRFEDVVVTRLLQFWESSTMIQGTITAHRLYSFKNLLSEGTVYKLSVFYVARSNNHFKLCASSLMALANTNVDLPDIFGQDRSIQTIYNDENESIQSVMVTIQLDRCFLLINPINLCRSTTVCRRLVLNVTLGTQFYFYHESQATHYYFTIITALVPTLNIPDAGSAEQRVVPLVYLPKYGGVKKLESVRLTKLNIYVLNSPLQHHTSDDMSVAVKLSMVPNPVVKSSCSYHTNGPDDVPIIEGCPASTDPEPAHTDSILTST